MKWHQWLKQKCDLLPPYSMQSSMFHAVPVFSMQRAIKSIHIAINDTGSGNIIRSAITPSTICNHITSLFYLPLPPPDEEEFRKQLETKNFLRGLPLRQNIFRTFVVRRAPSELHPKCKILCCLRRFEKKKLGKLFNSVIVALKNELL